MQEIIPLAPLHPAPRLSPPSDSSFTFETTSSFMPQAAIIQQTKYNSKLMSDSIKITSKPIHLHFPPT